METETGRLIVSGDSVSHRPRISRETRRLLMTIFFAVLALWILARIRFPNRPVDPNPVPPLLTQLAGPARLSDFASAIDAVRARLAPSLLALPAAGDDTAGSAVHRADRVPALRIHDRVAVAVLEPRTRGGRRDPPGVFAGDPASGLALIRTAPGTSAVEPALWTPEHLEQPRYLMASSQSAADVFLRPAFIGSLLPVEAPQWTGTVWALPHEADVSPGAFLFTEDAEFVGVVATYEGGLAVVPGLTLLAAADDLIEQPRKVPAHLGVEVQALTPDLSIASGARTGVIVTWVDPASVAARDLRAGDVIQTMSGAAVSTPERWRVRVARLAAGDTIELHVIRMGSQMDVQLLLPAPTEATQWSRLGLTMRSIARVGVEIERVDPASAAQAAGLDAGDVMTAIGDITAPTASQVRSVFAAAEHGDLLMVALNRGAGHHVVVLER